MILVCDVGGTHTRLAFAQRAGARWQLEKLSVIPTRAPLTEAIARYCRDAGTAIAVVACCGAGPQAADGSIDLTNNAVRLDPAALARAAGAASALLVNDFVAIAHAIPALQAEELRPLGGGPADQGAPRIVMGAGTGLGVAQLLPGTPWTVIAGEGGHAELAAHDNEQALVLAQLRRSFGRVSAETVLSGPGLEHLYGALAPTQPRGAREIAEAAWRGEPAARRAVHLFTRWLGHYAADLALIARAGGGIYLAGGIVPSWGQHFDAAQFRAAFDDHPRFGPWLGSVPAFVVTHPQPGLLGLAVLADAVVRRS